MSETLVELEGVALGYGRETILSNVDFELKAGEFVGIIGPNGSGKTTLLKGLLGLLPPRAGELRFPGGRPRFGYVQQRQFIDELFPLSARDVVAMGRLGQLGPFRRAGAADREAVDGALRTTGIEHLAEASYRELSGGQRQRCLLARALASEPDVLVLDEPTNDMDIAAEERILQLVQRIRREAGLTVLLVTHLLNVVLHHAEGVVLVQEGHIEAGPLDRVATSERLSDFYSFPIEVGRIGGRLVLVPGSEQATSGAAAPGSAS